MSFSVAHSSLFNRKISLFIYKLFDFNQITCPTSTRYNNLWFKLKGPPESLLKDHIFMKRTHILWSPSSSGAVYRRWKQVMSLINRTNWFKFFEDQAYCMYVIKHANGVRHIWSYYAFTIAYLSRQLCPDAFSTNLVHALTIVIFHFEWPSFISLNFTPVSLFQAPG